MKLQNEVRMIGELKTLCPGIVFNINRLQGDYEVPLYPLDVAIWIRGSFLGQIWNIEDWAKTSRNG